MHRNAPLTSRGRMLMVERIAAGRPVAHVAAEIGVSRKTAVKWWRRWLIEGEAGLEGRSSRPHRCPHQTPARVERRIVGLRERRKLRPARIVSIVGLPASTVHRVLCRHGLNQLAWMDRPTGQVIRRIHTDRPGELVHVDVKETGAHPARWWMAAPRTRARRSSEQAPSRLRLHPLRDRRPQPPRVQRSASEREGPDLRRFWERAEQFFAAHAIVVEAVLTDNAKNYLGKNFTAGAPTNVGATGTPS